MKRHIAQNHRKHHGACLYVFIYLINLFLCSDCFQCLLTFLVSCMFAGSKTVLSLFLQFGFNLLSMRSWILSAFISIMSTLAGLADTFSSPWCSALSQTLCSGMFLIIFLDSGFFCFKFRNHSYYLWSLHCVLCNCCSKMSSKCSVDVHKNNNK